MIPTDRLSTGTASTEIISTEITSTGIINTEITSTEITSTEITSTEIINTGMSSRDIPGSTDPASSRGIPDSSDPVYSRVIPDNTDQVFSREIPDRSAAYGQQAPSGQYGQSAPGSYSRQTAPNPGAMQNTGFPYPGNAQAGGNGQYQGNIPYQGSMQSGNNAPSPGNMPAGAASANRGNMPSAGDPAPQAAPAPARNVPLPPPPERPPLAVDKPVRKGQKVTLSMQPLKSITAYLDWNVKDGRCDIDVSAFLLGENGKVPGDDWFVFYGQPESPDASVSFNDSARIGRQSVHIDFSKVSANVKKVTFVLTINEATEQNLNFSMVKDACIKIVGVARDLEGLCELYGVQVSD